MDTGNILSDKNTKSAKKKRLFIILEQTFYLAKRVNAVISILK
jgi:hypothetical protein